jgi:hypothetical protein
VDTEEIKEGRHLGDGVYVSFDGYQLWLAVNHHTNKVVALEPGLLDRLNEYAQELRKNHGVQV